MRRKIFSIWAILLVLVVSLGVLGLGCPPVDGGGTIEVEATLDGSPWSGALDYTLTPDAGSPISGASVPGSHNASAGNWTCSYDGGGPPGADFIHITPDSTQELSDGETITFTLVFVTPQPVNASIQFETWTINGTPVPPGFYIVGPGTVIDAKYSEVVAGNNTGQPVKVKETLMTTYHWKGIEGEQGAAKSLHVVNAWGAVWGEPPFEKKLSQQATFNGQPVDPCTKVQCPWCEPQTLDVEIETVQKVGTNYTKNVNWIRFKPPQGLTQIMQGGLDEVVFEDDNLPFANGETFDMTAWACIEVEAGGVDTDPLDDCCAASPPISIMYWEGPFP